MILNIQNNYFIFNINGKGNKNRKIAISKDKIEKELDIYLDLINKIFKCKHKYLFISRQAKVLNRSSIYRIINQFLNKCNLKDRYKNGAHMLRHSYASLIYKESNNILLLQHLLGHSSIEATKLYTHLYDRLITDATKHLEVLWDK